MFMPQILLVLAAILEIAIHTEWGNTGHYGNTTDMKSMATCWKTLNSCQTTFPKIFCPTPQSSLNYQLLSPAGPSCSEHARHTHTKRNQVIILQKTWQQRDIGLALLIFNQTEQSAFLSKDSLQPAP